MPEISDELLHDVASNVARRIASGSVASAPRSGGGVLLALSSDGPVLDRALATFGHAYGPIFAVIDGADSSSPALASAMTRLPQLEPIRDADVRKMEDSFAGVDRVMAPAMSLALASRVAALQADTPAARVVLRAALRGVPVDVSLDEPDFILSEQAPAGAKRAVDGVLSRLRELGIHVPSLQSLPVSRAAAAAAGAAPFLSHPSADRFAGREPLRDFVDSLASKPCSIEPGQPCVDCGVCEMRGY